MEIKQKIGERIKELRGNQNLSQEALAFSSGLERSFITHIENGRRNVSIETLSKIINGLNISFFDFFNKNIFQNASEV